MADGTQLQRSTSKIGADVPDKVASIFFFSRCLM
jgi:hypothetical protein